jgi:hypothetical protein
LLGTIEAVGKPGGAVRTVSPDAGTRGKDTPPDDTGRAESVAGSISSKATIRKFNPAKGAGVRVCVALLEAEFIAGEADAAFGPAVDGGRVVERSAAYPSETNNSVTIVRQIIAHKRREGAKPPK